MAYAFDPELVAFLDVIPSVSLDDLAASRAAIDELLAPLNEQVDLTGVAVTDHYAPASDGAPDVLLRIYAPEGDAPAGGRPALLDVHGGGFVLGSITMEHAFASRVARELGVVVAAVDYRLAPEHPFPAGIDDCYAALSWLHAESGRLGIDPRRIAVGGESAGGGLTAGTVLLARDRGGPAVCFQYLGIPELDHRLETSSMRTFVDTPGWNRPNAVRSWEMYLGPDHDGAEVSPYASPAMAADLSNLPPTYLTTMEFDPLRDEGLLYALRLLEAGVTVEVHSFPGTFHGSSFIPATVSQRATDELLIALRRGLRVDGQP